MSELSKIFPNASRSFRELNPAMFGSAPLKTSAAPLAVPGIRIRQKQGPKLNKTETAFLEHLRFYFAAECIYAQAITYEIANGTRYTPDFVVMGHGLKFDLPHTAYEVKGPHAWEDSIVKLKAAARSFPAINFVLVWRAGRAEPWQIQAIKP